MNTFDPMLTGSQRNDGPKTLLQKNQRNVSVAASIKKKQQNVEQKENSTPHSFVSVCYMCDFGAPLKTPNRCGLNTTGLKTRTVGRSSPLPGPTNRSEERRVGKEGRSR